MLWFRVLEYVPRGSFDSVWIPSKAVFDWVSKKSKPKYFLLWPIAASVDYTMNQSQFEANTCNRRQARENACEKVTIGSGLPFH